MIPRCVIDPATGYMKIVYLSQSLAPTSVIGGFTIDANGNLCISG
jgi:hypothetical protein